MRKKLLAIFTILCLIVSLMPTMVFGDAGLKWGDYCNGKLTVNTFNHDSSCAGEAKNAEAYVTIGSSIDKLYFHDLDSAIEYANRNSSRPGAENEVTATVHVNKSGITINRNHDGIETDDSTFSPITGTVVLDLNGNVVYNISSYLTTKLNAGKLEVSGGSLTIKDSSSSIGYFENYNSIVVKNGGELNFDYSIIVEDLGEINLYDNSKLKLDSLTICGYIENYNASKPLITANGASTAEISGYVLNLNRTALKLEGQSTAKVSGYIYQEANDPMPNDGFPAIEAIDKSQFTLDDGIIETFCAPISTANNAKARLNGLLYAVGGSVQPCDCSEVIIGSNGLVETVYASGAKLHDKATLTVEKGGILASLDSPAVDFIAYTNVVVNNYGQIATFDSSKIESLEYASYTVFIKSEELARNTTLSPLNNDFTLAKLTKISNDETKDLLGEDKAAGITYRTKNGITASNATISDFTTSIGKKIEDFARFSSTALPSASEYDGQPTIPTIFAREFDNDPSYTINIGSPDPDKVLNRMSLIDKYYSSDESDLSAIMEDTYGYIYNDNGAAIYSGNPNGTINVYEGMISGKAGIVVKNGLLNIDSSDKNKEIIILGDGIEKDFRVFTYTNDFETGDAIILDKRYSNNPKANISGNSSNLLVGLSYGVKGKASEKAKAVSVYPTTSETMPKFISAGTYATDVKDFLMPGFTTAAKTDTTINKITEIKPIYVVESQQAQLSAMNTSLARRLVSYNGDKTTKPFVTVKIGGNTLKGVEVDKNGNPVSTGETLDGKDYTYCYTNWNSVGFARVEIKAVPQSRYTGSATLHYLVCGMLTADNLTNGGTSSLTSGYTVNVLGSNYVYNTGEIKPLITVKLGSLYVNPKDYTVKYDHNINAGTATVTVESKQRLDADNPASKPKYSGQTSFVIHKKDVALTPLSYTVALGGENLVLKAAANGYYKPDEDAVLGCISLLRYTIKDSLGRPVNVAGDVKDGAYKGVALTGENDIIIPGKYTIEFAEVDKDFSGMQNYNFILSNKGELEVLAKGSVITAPERPDNPENVAIDVRKDVTDGATDNSDNTSVLSALFQRISILFTNIQIVGL